MRFSLILTTQAMVVVLDYGLKFIDLRLIEFSLNGNLINNITAFICPVRVYHPALFQEKLYRGGMITERNSACKLFIVEF